MLELLEVWLYCDLNNFENDASDNTVVNVAKSLMKIAEQINWMHFYWGCLSASSTHVSPKTE